MRTAHNPSKTRVNSWGIAFSFGYFGQQWDKSKSDLGWFSYKIVDYARMAFHPCVIDDPHGRLFVRAIRGMVEDTPS